MERDKIRTNLLHHVSKKAVFRLARMYFDTPIPDIGDAHLVIMTGRHAERPPLRSVIMSHGTGTAGNAIYALPLFIPTTQALFFGAGDGSDLRA